MEIRQLRYFLKIAELGSFSRASQTLHVAQPALSHQIAQLDGELGHGLLHRRHNGVQMTEQGQAFYSQAQQILKEIDDAVRAHGYVSPTPRASHIGRGGAGGRAAGVGARLARLVEGCKPICCF